MKPADSRRSRQNNSPCLRCATCACHSGLVASSSSHAVTCATTSPPPQPRATAKSSCNRCCARRSPCRVRGSGGHRTAGQRPAAALAGAGGTDFVLSPRHEGRGQNWEAPAILYGRQPPCVMLWRCRFIGHRDEREIWFCPRTPLRAFGVNRKTPQLLTVGRVWSIFGQWKSEFTTNCQH